MNLDTKKFPRTQHIEGSRLQHGDGDMKVIPWSDLKRRPLVVSEKLDGANVGISFSDQGDLLLQSRGHYLRGGPREKQFDIFKQLANDNVDVLFDALCSRYILYGEWMYACHSIYYDDLPCYFHAFDVYDKERDAFLSTARRDGLLYDVYKTFITFAPVLAYQRTFNDINDLLALLGNCGYFTNERTSNYLITAHDSGFLRKDGENNEIQEALSCRDWSPLMEGLYVKLEDDERVLGRCKYVRSSFTNTIAGNEIHWFDRQIVQNKLRN